jgi:hypothetical protein
MRNVWEHDGGRLSNKRRLTRQSGGTQHVPAHIVVCRLLERVDDDVRHSRSTSEQEGLTNSQSRASIGQPDLNYNVNGVGNEYVTQNVGVRRWQRHALEIARERSATFRTGTM